MPRVKRGTMVKKRHNKILEAASGNFGGKRCLFKTANEQFMRSGNYAYRDRRNKKREFRALWITRINAGARDAGLTYSQFMAGLKKAAIDIDRKVLADLAVFDKPAFTRIVEQAKASLGA